MQVIAETSWDTRCNGHRWSPHGGRRLFSGEDAALGVLPPGALGSLTAGQAASVA